MELVEESPEKSVLRGNKCPLYTAGQMLGLNDKTIEERCRSGGFEFMNALIKQLNPKLTYQLRKFRSSPEDYCEEAITFE